MEYYLINYSDLQMKIKVYSLIYLIQLFIGMRIGQVLTLKIPDIDFKNKNSKKKALDKSVKRYYN